MEVQIAAQEMIGIFSGRDLEISESQPYIFKCFPLWQNKYYPFDGRNEKKWLQDN